MAWNINNSVRVAALSGICALFNGGSARLLTSADAELAAPTFGNPAFGTPTSASPSVATANALTADTSITVGTVEKIAFRDSATNVLINGTVGTSGADFNVTDNVIPSGATSVNITGLTFTLALS
jgi:hypothetical protein